MNRVNFGSGENQKCNTKAQVFHLKKETKRERVNMATGRKASAGFLTLEARRSPTSAGTVNYVA